MLVMMNNEYYKDNDTNEDDNDNQMKMDIKIKMTTMILWQKTTLIIPKIYNT